MILPGLLNSQGFQNTSTPNVTCDAAIARRASQVARCREMNHTIGWLIPQREAQSSERTAPNKNDASQWHLSWWASRAKKSPTRDTLKNQPSNKQNGMHHHTVLNSCSFGSCASCWVPSLLGRVVFQSTSTCGRG